MSDSGPVHKINGIYWPQSICPSTYCTCRCSCWVVFLRWLMMTMMTRYSMIEDDLKHGMIEDDSEEPVSRASICCHRTSPLIHLSAVGRLVPTSRGPLGDVAHSRTPCGWCPIVQSTSGTPSCPHGKMLPSWKGILSPFPTCRWASSFNVQQRHVHCLQFHRLQFLGTAVATLPLPWLFILQHFLALVGSAEALILIPAGAAPRFNGWKIWMIFGNVLRGKFGRDLVGEWRPPRGM